MKTRTITILKKDIFFDVDAATHVFAKATETENLRRADALESDTLDPLRVSMVTRYADRHVAELKERLSRFLTSETQTAHSATISTNTSYIFSLYVEDAFQDEVLEALGSAMEQYVADGCIADWYKDVGDAQSTAYQQYQQARITSILGYLVKRKFPART